MSKPKQTKRLSPLGVDEYENNYRETASDLELVERVFHGGMASNQLRAALWPYLFGLVKHRGRFKAKQSEFVYLEHEENIKRWNELENLYYSYQSQWKSIMPDQEMRFSTFRERKSLIERDVIRCDRLHPFYAEEPQNLASITSLLMTYMMYDFDIGYVQGMSDLACPILYLYNGNVVKSFWVFVEVMKLFRRNFELTQKTIHFQLKCLYELIKTTDPILAQYLEEHESSNCFFAFRAIVCQFKRELMKEDEDNYSKVLFLWDTIWSASKRGCLLDKSKSLRNDGIQVRSSKFNGNSCGNCNGINSQSTKSDHLLMIGRPVANGNNININNNNNNNNSSNNNNNNNGKQNGNSHLYTPHDQTQSDTPRHSLTETEIFVLSLCLAMIRRERDIIIANKLDGTDIHLHFIDPKLSSDLNSFIEHAINIYTYLRSEFDITKLATPKGQMAPRDITFEATPDSFDGYDLLSDFLIINGASGSR